MVAVTSLVAGSIRDTVVPSKWATQIEPAAAIRPSGPGPTGTRAATSPACGSAVGSGEGSEEDEEVGVRDGDGVASLEVVPPAPLPHPTSRTIAVRPATMDRARTPSPLPSGPPDL